MAAANALSVAPEDCNIGETNGSPPTVEPDSRRELTAFAVGQADRVARGISRLRIFGLDSGLQTLSSRGMVIVGQVLGRIALWWGHLWRFGCVLRVSCVVNLESIRSKTGRNNTLGRTGYEVLGMKGNVEVTG